MRVRLIGEQDSGEIDDLRRNVGMEIVRDHDREIASQRFPQPADDLGVAVRIILDDHRAVKRQQQSVETLSGFQPLDQLGGQGIEGLGGDRPGRRSPGEQRGNDFKVKSAGAFDEAGDLVVGVLPAQYLLPALEVECGEPGLGCVEGVRFVHDPADRDPRPALGGESSDAQRALDRIQVLLHLRFRSHLPTSKP